VTAHIAAGAVTRSGPSAALRALALVHGYTVAFWWSAAIFAIGAVVAAILYRWGPLTRQGAAGGTGAVPEDSAKVAAPPVPGRP
jgi:hypothetical protein